MATIAHIRSAWRERREPPFDWETIAGLALVNGAESLPFGASLWRELLAGGRAGPRRPGSALTSADQRGANDRRPG